MSKLLEVNNFTKLQFKKFLEDLNKDYQGLWKIKDK